VTVPDAVAVVTGNPEDRKTPIMSRLSDSVWATKVVMPLPRAASARWSRRSVPMPRCWWSSVTTKATSASVPTGSRS